MKDLKTCWNLLPQVSRSFSLCIKLLPKPIDDRMMLSYLVFRIIDTIEDSVIALKVKKELFDKFILTLDQESYNSNLTANCRIEMLKKLTYSYEENLLKNLEAVTRLFYHTPKNEKKALLARAKEMSKGMYDFQTRTIETFEDQNEYCYYVAGLVGYLFNDLFYYNGVLSKQKREHLMEYAKRYGLALQKVNVIRDIAYDIPDKRYYWPKEILKKHNLSYDNICLTKNRKNAINVLNDLIDDALNYLNDGIYYIMSIPRLSLKVRVFA